MLTLTRYAHLFFNVRYSLLIFQKKNVRILNNLAVGGIRGPRSTSDCLDHGSTSRYRKTPVFSTRRIPKGTPRIVTLRVAARGPNFQGD